MDEQPNTTHTWNVTVHGGAPQMGQGNTQNNTFGYDPAQLAAFAQQVLAAAHTTDVLPASRDAVTTEAEALQAELQRPQPDAGRVRTLFQKTAASAKANLPTLGWLGTAQAISLATGVPIGF
ncbi:hypothetical protein [Streptomyces virginiae]|uniref:hypothetical protein n=1 Tax=Streptomyces virginiae TaxID=1961 RepID=UPI0036E5D5F1